MLIFHKGERHWKLVDTPREGVELVKKAQGKGLKAHLVSRRRAFRPPEGDDFSALDEGKLWCPYCRRWRFFSIPRYDEQASPGSERWMINTYANQEVRMCQWCTISESDNAVRSINGLWGEESKRRRRRRRK